MDNDILYEYRYPRSVTLRCLAMLVGGTPIPGKMRSFVYEAYALFCDHTLRCGFARGRGLCHLPSVRWFLHLRAGREKNMYPFLWHWQNQACGLLLFSQSAIIIKPIIDGRKKYVYL